MPETLYVILKNGNILAVADVTALAIDNTLTIKPGDYYRDEYIEQTVSTGLVLTNVLGDQITPSALRTESWLCSYWKFTRGASLSVLRFRWLDVEAICDQYPNRVYSGANTGVLYVPLRSGNIAVITGMAASTAAVIQNTSLTVYPGDYYRNTYFTQTVSGSSVLTNQFGDAEAGDPLNPETWDASHMEFTRTGLLSLYIPERHVFGGPATSYPNRVAA